MKLNRALLKIKEMKRIVISCILLPISVLANAKMVPSDMSMAMFRSARIKEPTVFKAKVAIAAWDSVWSQERGPMENYRDQFFAVVVRPYVEKGDVSGFHHFCYVKKSSEAGKIVASELKDGGIHAALVCLRYSGNPDFEGVCVLDEIEMMDKGASSEVSVRFSGTRISLVKHGEYDMLEGKISASIKSSLKRFKRPVLRVVVLTDENGSMVVRDSIMDEPNIKMLNDSDTLTHKTTTAGDSENEPPTWQRYIEEISKNQSEVTKDTFTNVSYLGLPMGSQGRKTIKGLTRTVHLFGYAKFDRDENAKMIGYRIEMWYRGVCVSVYDTIRSGDLKRLQLPEDWHVSFKHPETFKYRTPYSKKAAVRN